MIDRTLIDKLTDIILKVAMSHHDDISKSDEDCAVNAAEEILDLFNCSFCGHLAKYHSCEAHNGMEAA